MEPCIIVHGGSRTILGDEKKEKHRKGVQLAARKGHEVLLKVGFNVLAFFVLKLKTKLEQLISTYRARLNPGWILDLDFPGLDLVEIVVSLSRRDW